MLPEIDSFCILKVDQNIRLIDERSRARRSAARHGVVGFIQGGQNVDLFTTCLLAAKLSCVVIR